MPYDIERRNGRYCVIQSDTGESLQCYDKVERAQAYLGALEAATDYRQRATFYRYTLNGVTCQATRRRSSTRDNKAWMRTVRYKGNQRLVHYADPDLPMRRNNESARRNFIARHNCDQKRDPFAPGFWSCYDWINVDEKSKR